MHLMMKIMGMLGWAGLSKEVLPTFCPTFASPFLCPYRGQNHVLWGKPNPFREGSRTELQDGVQLAGTPGSSQGKYERHSGVTTVSAEVL